MERIWAKGWRARRHPPTNTVGYFWRETCLPPPTVAVAMIESNKKVSTMTRENSLSPAVAL